MPDTETTATNVAALRPVDEAPVRLPRSSSAEFRLRDGVFASPAAFEHGQRMARALSASELVPATFRGNIPNTMIALDFAMRNNYPPMMILQNMIVIGGRPGWTSAFIAGSIITSGLFTPITHEFRGTENADDWACRVAAKARENDALVTGPWISIAMAKRDGWTRNAKWQSMPEVMLRHRATAFFGRLYVPHVLMGMLSSDELEDIMPAHHVRTISAEPASTAAAAPAAVVDPLATLRARISAPAAAEVAPTLSSISDVAPTPSEPVGTPTDAPAAPRRTRRARETTPATVVGSNRAPEAPVVEQPAAAAPVEADDDVLDPF